MTALTRRSATLLAVVLACVLPLGSAQAAGSENVASATIEQDDGRAFDFAWDIAKRHGDASVEDLNKAQAVARCTIHCKATAIAFQIVLVDGSPSTVIPKNVAEAVNLECTECTAVAEARQFVRVFPRPVKFTNGGRAVLSDVRRQLAALEAQPDIPIDQLHQAVETQEARVRQVLADEVVLMSSPDTEASVMERRSLQAVDLG